MGIAVKGKSFSGLSIDGKKITGMAYNGQYIMYDAKPKIVTFKDGTDEEIAAMLKAHYKGKINISDYWAVGNTRTIRLNSVANPKGSGSAWAAQNITIVITEINHHDLATPIGTRTKAAITCQTREVVNNNINSYDDYKNGHIYFNLKSAYVTDPSKVHWSAIGMRTWSNDAFFNTAMPTGIKNMIKPIKHNVLSTRGCSGTTNNGKPAIKTTEEAIDKIFLPTYPEIFGNIANNFYLSGETPTGEEGTQWRYYQTSANRVKYGNNNGIKNNVEQIWWIGSPSTCWESSDGGFWCEVYMDGSFAEGIGYGSISFGFAPAFCL